MKELCIDISTWQGGIDYNDIKAHCNYAILRAGFGDSDFDNQFENHYANLQGMHLGAYWYSYATSPEQARTEANLFLQAVAGKQFDLPLYIDMEERSGLGADTLNAITIAFGEVIEAAGYYFGVYSNLNWYNNIFSGSYLNSKYDWWIACWDDEPPHPSYGINYGVWQFGSTYIGGQNVDGNYIYKDYPTIIREAGLNHLDGPTPPSPTPTPTPTPSKTIDELANEVIAGLWGNGQERYDRLTAAGYDYYAVQNRVNEILYGGTEYYTIQPGDTLSGISERFGTSISQLCAWNNISNPDLIYAGDTIRVR